MFKYNEKVQNLLILKFLFFIRNELLIKMLESKDIKQFDSFNNEITDLNEVKAENSYLWEL